MSIACLWRRELKKLLFSDSKISTVLKSIKDFHFEFSYCMDKK